MSRRRLENLDAERQRRLFESASEEFAAKGYDAASLNRILEKSGMSKSSLYYYFDDKADLFTTLIERTLSVVLKEVGGFDPNSLTAENYWSEFEKIYRRALAVIERNAWLVKFGGMFYRLRNDPKEGSATGRIFQAARKWVDIVLVRGQEVGVVRTDLPQSLLVDSTMSLLESLDRWGVAHWSELTESEKQAMPAQHIELFRRFLAPENETATRP
ncbi:MAG: TetR/AcrR family transcriptional regulator [Armatimonadetes bacterium]|nr:TetR/AcrR family transcriptional regulator [Armatimonadota bacterium]